MTPERCLAALESRGLEVEPWDAPRRGACRVETPVRVAHGVAVAFEPQLETSCELLQTWTKLEPQMDALAQRHLDSPVQTIRHYGSHSCRRSTGNRRRMSAHARGNAIDIARFELADGSSVSVLKDWGTRNDRGRFLAALVERACRLFGTVLTPAYDRPHRDHLHFELGPEQVCARS